MKRVLITGITGYIGSQLARVLSKDCNVYGLIRDPVNETYLTPELRKKVVLLPYDGSGESVLTALKASEPDIVYHLATCYTTAHDVGAVLQLFNSNLMLGTYLLEAMSSVGCRRLVYATTVTTHYRGKGYQPLTLYAATKQAFSDLVEYYTLTGMINAAALALSDTYGPSDCRPKVLNRIRKAVIEQTPLKLTSGRQIFDTVYIDDVVRGFVCASESLENADIAHQFFQLSGLNPRPLRDTVELMLQINDLDFKPNWGGEPDPDYLLERPLSVFPAPPKWKPCVSLENGLREFWGRNSLE